MRKLLLPVVMGAAVAAFAAVLMGAPDRVTATDAPVAVGDLYFCDSSFQGGVCETTVTAGDRVVWSVQSGSHTVTECDSTFATCPPAGGFDSGALNQTDQFDRTFTSAGTFYYYCAFHPSLMRGRIVVQAAQATPTPTPSATASPTPTGTGAATATATASATPAAVPAAGGEPGEKGGEAVAELALLTGILVSVVGALVLRRWWAAGSS